MTPLFLGIVALISLLALALLARPLLRRGGPQRPASRQALNAAIYGDQLQELERDRASGSLADSDFEQAQSELQRRLLEDVQVVDEVEPLGKRPNWQIMVLLAVALPTAAMVTYISVGHPHAQQATMAHDDEGGQVEQMVAALAARLEKNPDDIKGWGMLARSYKAMRRFDEADRAFAKLGDALYSDPTLLSEYADLLAVRANNLEGKPLQLVMKALQLDPNHLMALSLAGTAAYNRADYPATLRYWEQLYKLLPADSEDARSLSSTLAEVRGKAGVKAPPAAKAAKAGATTAKNVSGQVSLSPKLKDKLKADDVLFVFARPADGSRMPLAVLRGRAGDLPLKFTLDDSMAISPEAKLSGAAQVKIEARISKSGTANPGPGDLVGESAAVAVGAKGLQLVIDTVRP